MVRELVGITAFIGGVIEVFAVGIGATIPSQSLALQGIDPRLLPVLVGVGLVGAGISLVGAVRMARAGSSWRWAAGLIPAAIVGSIAADPLSDSAWALGGFLTLVAGVAAVGLALASAQGRSG